MREVPSTHRWRRNVLGSKPRAQQGAKVSNLIDIKTMFDAGAERDHKRLAKALATLVDEVSPAVSLINEE